MAIVFKEKNELLNKELNRLLPEHKHLEFLTHCGQFNIVRTIYEPDEYMTGSFVVEWKREGPEVVKQRLLTAMYRVLEQVKKDIEQVEGN